MAVLRVARVLVAFWLGGLIFHMVGRVGAEIRLTCAILGVYSNVQIGDGEGHAGRVLQEQLVRIGHFVVACEGPGKGLRPVVLCFHQDVVLTPFVPRCERGRS